MKCVTPYRMYNLRLNCGMIFWFVALYFAYMINLFSLEILELFNCFMDCYKVGSHSVKLRIFKNSHSYFSPLDPVLQDRRGIDGCAASGSS